MNSITLYSYSDLEIKISIDAYFDGEALIIDGYDRGNKVKEYWGDFDYEYMVRIPAKGVDFLCDHLHIPKGDKQGLLNALTHRYNSNTCYSDIRKLMNDNGIECEGFSWP
ncbi:MAG: hypothetical protein KF687_12190 [Cyclobacteriaceae bacterium]|nr:hypothetical protein [Cyclobacteriaceae bacterium]